VTWTTFPTLTDGQVLTGAHMQLVRDNFAETAPAKASAAGRFIVTSGVNSVAERAIQTDFVGTAETSAATSYGDLATVGPSKAATTGPSAIVMLSADAWNSAAGYSHATIEVSGATVVTTSDVRALSVRVQTGDANAGSRATAVNQVTLTPGSNTFTARYRVTAGTGRWSNRSLIVIPL
jgi:hypothetical protein